MSILDRISRLIRANVNDLLNKAEDPEKIINQALEDMREAYYQARNEVASAMAEVQKLERERKSQEAQASEYESKATEALNLGREDLAREALKRKKSSNDVANALAAQLDRQNQILERLKMQLRGLESKIDELEGEKKVLAARQKTVEATETLDKVSGFDSANSAMAAVERMKEKVQQKEDEVSAKSQLYLNKAPAKKTGWCFLY
jgi:phage shock protein A